MTTDFMVKFGYRAKLCVHSAEQRLKTASNIAIPIQKYSIANISYTLCKYDENRSNNPRDYEGNKWTFLDETVSHRISHQLLERSLPTFQRWYLVDECMWITKHKLT